MTIKWIGFLFLILLSNQPVFAGVLEISGTGSISSTNYGDSSFVMNRRWTGSFGYYMSSLSEIEVSLMDSYSRNHLPGFEDTTFHSQVYSVDWIQSLTPKDSTIQPFFKIGLGQLNQEASGSYIGGVAPPAILDSITAVLGAGVRIILLGNLGLKGEATTYLTGGQLSTWQNNYALSVGFSLYL